MQCSLSISSILGHMQMGIQQEGGVGKDEISNESKKSKKRQKKLSRVQRLYDACKLVFADSETDIVPSPDKVQKIAALLDGMTLGDVGLMPNMPFFSSKLAPVITYLHLHECDKFSIGIFCLPPTSVIPLHNHPGMTVFSKLLFGTMHIKAYDWSNEVNINTDGTSAVANAPKSEDDGLRLAKLKVDSEFTAPCRTSILYPADGGNMHCFTAKTACAVLDVLVPPYSDAEGRHCQYYHEFPLANFPVEGLSYAWLKERENPEGFTVVGAPYNGPRIAKN